MMQQLGQNQKKTTQQIVPTKVWPSLTDKQQQQFVQTIETICQQLARRWMRQQEGDDAIS
jgi:hypothetical protein